MKIQKNWGNFYFWCSLFLIVKGKTMIKSKLYGGQPHKTVMDEVIETFTNMFLVDTSYYEFHEKPRENQTISLILHDKTPRCKERIRERIRKKYKRAPRLTSTW